MSYYLIEGIIMDKIICTECRKKFGSQEALAMHTQAKHLEKNKKSGFQISSKQKSKKRNWSLFIIAMIITISGVYFLTSSIKTLPPTDISGHVEASPSSHVLKEPMPIPIQKHMLEHADGTGLPGVVINYNCEDYRCEDNLIEKLEAFAVKYSHVYVAPFPDMGARIALTKRGKIETLDSYDEQRIEKFM